MASITAQGTRFRVQINIGGIRDSGTFETKPKARAWAAMRETQLRTQGDTGIIAGKTVGECFDRYGEFVSPTKKGCRWEVIRMNAIRKHVIGKATFGSILLADLTPDMLGQWRDSRLKEIKGSTFNRDMNLLSNIMATARDEWRWISESPTRKLKRPKDPAHRERRITDAEIAQMQVALMFNGEAPATASQFVCVAFLFALETGMRAGEICALVPEWIAGAVVHLPASANKNGVKRDVPMTKRALELLALLPKDKLFSLNSSNLDALFRKARNKTSIIGMTFHDTRHEAITRLSSKIDVLALAKMVGHTDIKMLLRYYNESAADVAARLG